MKWYGNNSYQPELGRGRDKEYESTLTSMYGFITHNRRDGNSTRLVDNAIQILYDGKVCVVEDHHGLGKNIQANRYLMDKIIHRLSTEHNLSAMMDEDKIRIDMSKLEIEFKVPDPRYTAYITTLKKQLDEALYQQDRIPRLTERSNWTFKQWKDDNQCLFKFGDIL